MCDVSNIDCAHSHCKVDFAETVQSVFGLLVENYIAEDSDMRQTSSRVLLM